MKLFATGSNGAGQLGIGHVDDVSIFTPCDVEGEVRAVASGGSHTLLLLAEAKATNNGPERLSLFGAGSNAHGQLGLGADITRFSPLTIPLSPPLPSEYSPILVACAWTTSFVVYRAAGSLDVLVSLGTNNFGELGVGEEIPAGGVHIIDLDLRPGEMIVSISSGQRHVVCTISTGSGTRERLVGWGAARHGQMSSISTACAASKTKAKGKSKALPKCFSTPTAIIVPGSSKIQKAVVGSTHTVFLTDSGGVCCFGSNAKGQCEPTDADEFEVVDVGCTWNGTYRVAKGPGRTVILSRGSNTHGQLGRDHGATDLSMQGIPTPAIISQLVCGSEHVLAISEDKAERRLWVCGWNEHGNLGLGDKRDRDRLTLVEGLSATAPGLNLLGAAAGCGTSFLWFS